MSSSIRDRRCAGRSADRLADRDLLRGVTTLHGEVGLLTAVWGAGLPVLDARVDFGPARLGLLLLMLALGAAVAMPLAGWLARRRSDAAVLRIALPAAGLVLAVIGAMPDAEPMFVLAVVFGLCCGGVNVGLTAQAAEAERRAGRPVIARMHGCWTLGAVVGASLLAAVLRAGADGRILLPGVALGTGLLLALVAVRLPEARAAAPASPRITGAQEGRASRAAGGTAGTVLFGAGAVAAAAFVVEGAATDWAGIHATRVLGADPAAGAALYAVFFAAMTAVRFAGDHLRARVAAPALVVAAAAATVLGFVLVLLSPAVAEGVRLPVAGSGWALAGAGTALVWPIVDRRTRCCRRRPGAALRRHDDRLPRRFRRAGAHGRDRRRGGGRRRDGAAHRPGRAAGTRGPLPGRPAPAPRTVRARGSRSSCALGAGPSSVHHPCGVIRTRRKEPHVRSHEDLVRHG